MSSNSNRRYHLINVLQQSASTYFNFLRHDKKIKAKPELLAEIGRELMGKNSRMHHNGNLFCTTLMLYIISGKEQDAEKFLKMISRHRLRRFNRHNLSGSSLG